MAWFGVTLVANMIALAAGAEVLPHSSWLALVAVVAVSGLQLRACSRGCREAAVRIAAGVGVALGVGLALSAVLFDLSFDGNAYHQETLLLLMQGWNPLYQPIVEFDTATVFPKGDKIIAATISGMLDNKEAGKFINLAMMATSGLLVYGTVLRTLSTVSSRMAATLAVLGVANPIALCQLFTYYVDGLLLNTLLAAVAAGVLYLHQPSGWRLTLLATAGVLAIVFKHPGLPYAGMVFLGLLLSALLVRRWREARQLALAGIATALVGIGVIGFNPYVTNLIHQGHLFHPVMGENRIDYAAYNRPQAPTVDGAHASKWTLFRLAHTSFATAGTERHLKWPFQISLTELGAYRSPDPRAGGYGPWFSLLALLTIIVWLRLLVKKNSLGRHVAPLTLLMIIASVLIHPVLFIPRSVPQVYWLVWCALVLAWCVQGNWWRRSMLAVTALACVNGALVLAANGVHQVVESARQYEQLDFLAASRVPAVFAFSHHYVAYQHILDGRGISYTKVPAERALPCRAPFLMGRVWFCHPEYDPSTVHNALVRGMDEFVSRAKR